MERMMELGTGRSWVRGEWRRVGADISITLIGGEAPHIGAAALAWSEENGVVVRVLTVPEHKESELAASCAREVCRVTGRTVFVECGIHIDQAERQEIERLCEHTRLITERLAGLLAADRSP